MNLSEILRGLKKASKRDEVPGTYEQLNELCPVCNSKMKLKKACCSNPNQTKECTNGNCGYKIVVDNSSV